MAFDFQNPSIHNVKGVSAYARTVTNFACVTVTFHGQGENDADPQRRDFDVYFGEDEIEMAHKLAAAINSLKQPVSDAA